MKYVNLYKTLVLFFFIPLFIGCSQKSPSTQKNLKVFEEEDSYILFALDAQLHKEYLKAYKYYEELYNRSEKIEYLQQMFLMLSDANKNEAIIKLSDKFIEKYPNEYALYRYKISAYLKLNDLKSAKIFSLQLVELSHLQKDYLLVSDIYKLENSYDIALKYLESAYIIDFSEVVMDKMALLLYVDLKQKKDAIAQLETHIRMHGCSEKICNRLISFYSEENNIDGALSVYLRLYNKFEQNQVAEKIVEIYAYKKDYIKLEKFLEKSSVNNKLLLKILVNSKQYLKAYKIANKLYLKEHKIDFLAQSAIYYYEANSVKSDAVINKSIALLEEVIVRSRDPLYLNYLGYLLIDHNRDIERGMKLVNEALRSHPNSPFYIDSLAWGYYKLKECSRAYDLMQQVQKALGSEDSEVKEHIKRILECQTDEREKN